MVAAAAAAVVEAAAPVRGRPDHDLPAGLSAGGVQVLIDADNVAATRLRLLLDALTELAPDAAVWAAGRTGALERTDWPDHVVQLVAAGWQRADLALAEVYRRDTAPLVLASGDGDFGLLAGGHPGPVLVVSGSPSYRLTTGSTVVDPALDGPERLREWLRAVQ